MSCLKTLISPIACSLLSLLLGVAAHAQGTLPRAEHPRPDAMRAQWLNLNGQWQFEIDDAETGVERGLITGKELPLRITVPFALQSTLSGLAETGYHRNLWYRRHFAVPANMKGQRLLLHFGAVDYSAKVYLNGQFVGAHVGGSASFNVEVSQALREGENELVVHVIDDLRNGVQPKGKQALVSEGCLYTGTSGIWQTVWLEAVGPSYIENLSVLPDLATGSVRIEATLNRPLPSQTLRAVVLADGRKVGEAQGPVSGRTLALTLPLSERRTWEPGSPFLYDLQLGLEAEGRTVDALTSYFGLRSVSVQGRRVLLNGKPVFQRLILDQGFYPDGIWTAPSDAALRRDIELSMAAGFNGARLHQKVFEPRFLYWADKLGYLVWGEFPNWGLDYGTPSDAPYANEWMEVMLRDRNHPALIGWCPFNETGAGQLRLQELIWNITRALDPTRPVIESSGWTHGLDKAEIRDSHDYDQNPASFGKRWNDFFNAPQYTLNLPPRYGYGRLVARDIGVPFMLSEYGGIAWNPDGAGWGYGDGPKDLEAFYTRYKGLTDALLDNPNLFGFTYTQLTDVEQERNGLFYYDRRVKFDLARLHAITSRQAAYERGAPMAPVPQLALHDWRVLVGAATDGPGLCLPYSVAFDATGPWFEGKAPFGPAQRQAATVWKGRSLFLKRAFNYNGEAFRSAALALGCPGHVKVRLNGLLVLDRATEGDFSMIEATEALRAALRKGANHLEIECLRDHDEGTFDMALLVD